MQLYQPMGVLLHTMFLLSEFIAGLRQCMQANIMQIRIFLVHVSLHARFPAQYICIGIRILMLTKLIVRITKAITIIIM